MSVSLLVEIDTHYMSTENMRELLEEFGDVSSVISMEDAAIALRDGDRDEAIEAMEDRWCSTGIAQLLHACMHSGRLHHVLGGLFDMSTQEDISPAMSSAELETDHASQQCAKLFDFIRNSKPYNPDQEVINYEY